MPTSRTNTIYCKQISKFWTWQIQKYAINSHDFFNEWSDSQAIICSKLCDNGTFFRCLWLERKDWHIFTPHTSKNVNIIAISESKSPNCDKVTNKRPTDQKTLKLILQKGNLISFAEDYKAI